MKTNNIFANLYTSKYFEKLPDFKEKKIQAFITIALTLIALSFFAIFAINPTLSTIANLQKQSEDNTFVEQKLDVKFSNLNTLTESYKSIEPELSYVYNALPKTAEVPSLIGQFATLGTQNNVIVSRIQIYEVDLTKTQEGAQKFSTIGFSIEAQGTFINILKYINSVTDFERIVTIDTISLSKGTEKDANLKLSIRGKAYFKR